MAMPARPGALGLAPGPPGSYRDAGRTAAWWTSTLTLRLSGRYRRPPPPPPVCLSLSLSASVSLLLSFSLHKCRGAVIVSWNEWRRQTDCD